MLAGRLCIRVFVISRNRKKTGISVSGIFQIQQFPKKSSSLIADSLNSKTVSPIFSTKQKKYYLNRGKVFISCPKQKMNNFALVVKYNQVEEKQVIAQVVTGDLNTFEMVFRDYYKPLVRYGNTFLKDTDETEDVVQQVFVSLWEKRTQLDIHTSIRAVLYKSVQNACLNKIKHLKVRSAYAEDWKATQSEMQTSDSVQAKELNEQIQLAIEGMPEQCGRIFKMSRFEQLRYQEIADQLGLSVKTVENQMGKALKIVREELKDYLPLLILLFSQTL